MTPLPSSPPPATAVRRDRDEALRRLTFSALGTKCEVQFAAPGGDAQARAFEHAVVHWVMSFEARYSRFRADSLVSQINAAAGRHAVDVDTEMEQMLQLADTLYTMTQGILDATCLPLQRLWDFRAAEPRPPASERVQEARALVGWKQVQRGPGSVFLPRAGMALDFGGFGKEYAIDRVAQLAADHGITQALVDFGHDLRAVGRPPGRPAWHIGLEDPARPGAVSGSVAVTDAGVASSGDYLRGFTFEGRRYGHIIDPRTGWPVAHGCRQVTVVARSCLQAGALSTTAFVLGLVPGLAFIQAFPGAEGMIVGAHERGQTRGFFRHVVA